MNYNLRDVVAREAGEITRILVGRKVPESVIWFLTERCNLSCGHCFVSHGGRKFRDELNFGQIKRVLDTSQGSIKRISFTGGEPLIHREFDKVFIYASSLPQMKQLHVSTNGMCNEKLFSILKDCNNDQVQYQIQSSVDGPEKIHNAIRGNKNAYKEFIRLLDMFKDFKSKSNLSLDMNLVMTVSRRNLHTVQETMELAKFYDIPLTINFVRSSSDSNLRKDEISDFVPQGDADKLSIKEIKSVVEEWCRLAVKNCGFFVYRLHKIRMDNLLQYNEKGTWKYPCAAGINDAVIFSDGSISVCETKKPFAKLQDFDFDYRKLWEKHFNGKLHACYCSYDCAINYSINKSAKGYLVFAKSLIGL